MMSKIAIPTANAYHAPLEVSKPVLLLRFKVRDLHGTSRLERRCNTSSWTPLRTTTLYRFSKMLFRD